MEQPLRGDVWMADLNPIRGHEQAGQRPVLIVSDDGLNKSRAELVIVCPFTSTITRSIPSHILVEPPEGGLSNKSVIMCEAIRSIDKVRLLRRLGEIDHTTMATVEDRLKILLSL